ARAVDNPGNTADGERKTPGRDRSSSAAHEDRRRQDRRVMTSSAMMGPVWSERRPEDSYSERALRLFLCQKRRQGSVMNLSEVDDDLGLALRLRPRNGTVGNEGAPRHYAEHVDKGPVGAFNRVERFIEPAVVGRRDELLVEIFQGGGGRRPVAPGGKT